MLSDEYSSERRPIATREKETAKKLANWLIARHVTPNAISVTGMVVGIAAGIAFAVSAFEGWRTPGFVGAAILMQLRLLANMLDGMVAVQTLPHCTSQTGRSPSTVNLAGIG